MKTYLIIVALALTGCAKLPQVPVFRDTNSPIGSAAVVDWDRMAGPWVEVARFDTAFQRGCGRSTWHIGASAVALECPRGGQAVRVAETAQVTGPGRLRVRLGGAPLDLWVLWVDEGYRTVALGTPDGTMGWILDRAVASSADRINAAREMLEFNGYDLDALKERL